MTPATPALLVSVRDAAEARDAWAGGSDWIDLKEPRRGALGAVDAPTAQSVVKTIAGRVPVSAAAGELVDWPNSTARELLNVPGVSHLKLGLAGCGDITWRPQWLAAQREIAAAGKQLVAVVYADWAAAQAPPPEVVLRAADDAGCPWVLWDTCDKAQGPLDAHIPRATLQRQLAAARTAGQRTVVAGRLDRAALDRLPLALIDMIGVRGAVCSSTRDSQICQEKVAAFRRALVTPRSPEGSSPCSITVPTRWQL